MTSAKEHIAASDAYVNILILLGHTIKIIGERPNRPNQYVEMEFNGDYYKFKLWNYSDFLKSIIHGDIDELLDKAWQMKELDR